MADYQARINLLVTGQNRLRDVQTQLQQIEQTITDLERRQRVAGAAAGRSRTLARAIGGTEQPRGPAGQFTADPNRQQRFAILAAQRRSDVEERLSRILGARARAEADSINTRIAGQNRVNRRVEAQITLESRLNAAVDLYRTNLQKFERAGGTTNVALNRQVTTIRDAFAAFEAGGSRNLRLVRSLATELGRVGEAQREINRTQSLGSKGFEAGRRLQERLTVVGQAGVTDPAQIRRVRSLATEAIAASRTGDQQAYQEAIRRATAATARLERESRETAQALNAATKGYASSPLRGTATMQGSPAFLAAQGQRRSAVRGRIGGAVSGAAIGGAFPLLFGQGAGAAAGGAIGGLAGGLLGPGGSFAGSLIGTILGDIAAKGNVVKKLGEDIGFSTQQTKTLETAFKQAGSEFDKFQASVQNIRGLGLDIEAQAESIKLVSTLTEKYGGTIDKVTNAFTSALESGKVTQATLNQLTSQGIPIQQALADKYKVSRSELLQMAKDGKISVQELTDTLIQQANTSVKANEKQKSGFDILNKASKDLGTAINDLGSSIVTSLTPAFSWLSGALGGIISLAAQAVQGIANALKGGTQETVVANARARQRLAAEGGPSTGTRYLTPKQTARLQTLQKEEQAKIPKVTEKVGPIDVSGVGQLPPSGEGKSSKGTAKKERESQLADILAANGLFRSQETIAARIAVAEVDRNNAEVARLQYVERGVQLLYEAATIQRSNIPLDEKQAQLRGVQDKLTASLNQYEREIALDKIAQVKAANEIIADLKLELALKTATTEEERKRLQLAADRAKLEEQLKGLPQTQIDQITALQAQVSAPLNDAQNIEQRIGQIKDEVAELTSISNIAIASAEGIGNAFAQSFQGLISGTLTAKEALSSFFKSVADMFLEMAAQIIAKQITMIILQTILKALGVSGGGGGGGGGNFSNAFGSGGPTFNPEGFTTGSYGSGIAPFANGGIVSSPTLFKFADGGTTRTGLMGEAGPEAIMPLKRGADGSLGVQANGLRDAMDRDRSNANNGSPVLNMSFQSTSINGVEYVSRDQLEQAMEQTRRDASREGAKRGMTMTLDKLQQSPSTRSRVGLR